MSVRCLALLLPCLFACALSAQAEIEVLRGAVSIADGGADTISNTGTSPFNISYTIRNDGAADLTLTGMPEVAVSGESNCTVSLLVAPVSPVAPGGGTTSFTLQVSPLSAATFSFEVSIASDDADETPYDYTFTGYTSLPAATAGDSEGGGDDCSTRGAPGSGLLVLAGLLASALAAFRNLRRVD
jgi:hypothetical protein